MDKKGPSFKGYRFPKEVISYTVWLYHRFMWSLRDIEELLLQRSITVTYETIREWCLKFGPYFMHEIKRRGDKWHLDEMCLVINWQKYWLWRAVDQDGYELDILVQSRRSKKAAKRFFRQLLKGLHYAPRVLVTDKLKRLWCGAKNAIIAG